MDVVTKALDFYDKNREKYEKYFTKVKYIKKNKASTSDMDRNEIIFFDKNNKQIGKSRFEKLGTYYSESRTWVWSWAKANNSKNETYIARKILNYALDINLDYKKSDEAEQLFLKTELITSRFRIHDPIQLDVHIAVSSYISKMPVIIPYIVHYTGDEKVSVYSRRKYYSDYNEIFDLKNYFIDYIFLLDYQNINLD